VNLSKLLFLPLLLTCDIHAEIIHNPHNIGSILHFPAYYAVESAGWHTKVRVTNTNLDKSIVAKLVLRERTRSIAKVDILLYLGPNDVFDADIREIDEVVYLTTVDNSHNMHIGDLDGRVSENAEGQLLIALRESTTIDERIQNNQFGSIEVYGLVENNSSEVGYSDTTCNSSEAVKFDRNNNVTGVTCNGTNSNTTDLSQSGVEHEKLVKAALLSVDANNMGENGWSDVVDGLMGEVIILSDNINGHVAMAYQAMAFVRSDANRQQPYSNLVTPAAQRYQDTNLLMYNDASLIQSMEDVISKSQTYVTHYAKDGRLPTKVDNQGDMAETRLLANFITKKYSVESASYIDNNPYPTYGINYAAGNIFGVEAGYNTEKVYGRNVEIKAEYHDHYEAYISAPSCAGVTCTGEVYARTDNNAIVSIDVRNDSPYSDGYVTYNFIGYHQRSENKLYAMPYIPLVMSAVTFEDGTNVTNIKYPASHYAPIIRQAEVSFYSDENATGYDLTPNEDGLIK